MRVKLSLLSRGGLCVQGGVLSVAGASVGLGLGVTTWSPWLCLLPADDFPAVVWVQVGIMVAVVPIAMLAAAYSQPLARAVWKRALLRFVFARHFRALVFAPSFLHAPPSVAARAGRTTPRSYKDRFTVSVSILLYLSFIGLLHTASLGSISRHAMRAPWRCVRVMVARVCVCVS